ncbi:MAG: cache domain-containing protein [Proteobacteria bacterium]|nr:cache domain-containing protein [Pseudomonadota bacterium]MBS0553327.1 cache domain-containing protein [Pseudomonadota bacterium]
MKLHRPVVVSLALAFSCLLAASAGGAADQASVAMGAETAEAARTQALLDRAEAFLRDKGDQALAAFSRSSDFQAGDLYVYVLGRDGTFLASGGASSTLIGRNVRDMTDSDGRPFFREILDGAQTRASGQVQYRWLNPVRGRNEYKIASYRTVGDRILVVGYYVPNASLELAKSMVWRAVHELKQRGTAAFDRFNSPSDSFVQEDLYVFAIGLDDELMYANGANPRMIGRKVGDLTDANGRHFVREMLDIARRKGEGEVEYAWRNPASQKVEKKRAYIVRVGAYLVGSGAYLGPLH